MINNIITLENQDKYLILLQESYLSDIFYIGVKLINEKYTNQFKLFLEKKDKEDFYLEEINDNELLTVIVNKYMLKNID